MVWFIVGVGCGVMGFMSWLIFLWWLLFGPTAPAEAKAEEETPPAPVGAPPAQAPVAVEVDLRVVPYTVNELTRMFTFTDN